VYLPAGPREFIIKFHHTPTDAKELKKEASIVYAGRIVLFVKIFFKPLCPTDFISSITHVLCFILLMMMSITFGTAIKEFRLEKKRW